MKRIRTFLLDFWTCSFSDIRSQHTYKLLRCVSAAACPARDGFSDRFKHLLRRGAEHARLTDSLACSPEALIEARRALQDATSTEGIAPGAIAKGICDHYQALAEDEREVFLSLLARDLGVEHERVVDQATSLVRLYSQQRAEKPLLRSEGDLRQLLTPFYCLVFTEIAKLEGGVKFLVDLRGDMLSTRKKTQKGGSPDHLLLEMGRHLKDILDRWFMPRLLDLQQVTWESPCDLLEKVSSYEAVHPLRHWKDLKHRLGRNRRCFVFLHRALPREPLIILHVALTSEPASKIKTLLDRTRHQDLDSVTTANFYSISATQKGLSGVELGDSIIKRVVLELQREFPKELSTFVTLSPVPGFKDWLTSHLKLNEEQGENLRVSKEDLDPLMQLFPCSSSPIDALRHALTTMSSWSTAMHNNEETEVARALRMPLIKLCARYLVHVKRRKHALDPVANFHLQNGASIWRLNWLADSNMHRSYGLMVNYLYHLPHICSNSHSYCMYQHISHSTSISDCLDN